jgi:predicted transcriptional regulator
MNVKNILEIYEVVSDDLKFLLTSGVRTKVIISLIGGPRNLGDLKKELNLDAASISHALKNLAERQFVVKMDNAYNLSQKGKIICIKLVDGIRTVYVVQGKEKLWLNHDIEYIPKALLSNLGDLSDSILVESEPTDLFKPFENYNNILLESDDIKGLSPIFRLDLVESIQKRVENGADVELIFTSDVLTKLLSTVDPECLPDLENYISRDNLKIWQIDNEVKIAFTVTDKFLSLGLFSSTGEYDSTKDLVSDDPDALAWGNRLFDYYKAKSKLFHL